MHFKITQNLLNDQYNKKALPVFKCFLTIA